MFLPEVIIVLYLLVGRALNRDTLGLREAKPLMKATVAMSCYPLLVQR